MTALDEARWLADEEAKAMMEKPTPAQIEAAAKALRSIRDWTTRQDDVIWYDEITTLHDLCEQALTAAVQVGERKSPDIHGTPSEIWDTAYHAGFHAGQTSIEKVTIERCAQVAEKFENRPLRFEIAAAIRALKEQP